VPTAIITGVTGQDGSYLAELLVDKGYQVVGIVRPASQTSYHRISAILDHIKIVSLNILDQNELESLLKAVRPAEFYNFAARASSLQLFSEPLLTSEINGMAVARMLEAIRTVDPKIRFCQASSSEMYGSVSISPQSENTAFHPQNPYGIAKHFAHCMLNSYRTTHGLFACSAILFNHESPRRGFEFVTRKISIAAARISRGKQSTLALGNLDATRDWGYAADYVHAMWMMLQQQLPSDFVLATGLSHSVRDFCKIAFERVGIDYQDRVTVDEASKRPAEPVIKLGDPSKARRILGWETSVNFDELVQLMVDSDVKFIESNA
jgi:GDPmannose 4,6-dehydratase